MAGEQVGLVPFLCCLVTWVKLDDQMTNHPKIEAIGVVGLGLHVAALCYANQQLTDGFISATRVPLLINMDDVDRRWDDAKSLDHPAIVWADALVGAGVWEEVEGGYQIHDYLKYQPSRREVLKDREKRRGVRVAAGQQGGQQTASKRAANAHSNVKQLDSPVARSPLPDPLAAAAAREKAPPDDLHRRAYNAWDRQAPGGLLPPIIDHLNDEIEAGTPVEWIELACESAAENGGRKPWKYVKATIERYRTDGPGDRRQPQEQPQDSTSAFMSGLIKKGA